MKKIGFAMGCVSMLLGVLVLTMTMTLTELVPKLGMMAFQLSAAGSYSPSDYELNFMSANLLASFLIVAGLVAAVAFYRSGARAPLHGTGGRGGPGNLRVY